MADNALLHRLSALQRTKLRRVVAGAAPAGEAEAGELNVVPFLDIVTNVMMFVLATLAVTFTSTVATTPPRLAPRAAVDPTLGLSVLVVPDGFSVKARGGNVGPGCQDTGAGIAVPKRDGSYDFTALKACAARLKSSVPEAQAERDVLISANPEVRYETVIATLDAVRLTDSGDDLFPDARFGVGR